MPSRFPSSWLEDLRTRSDLVQIVSGYVGLKKSGRKYWGLCPFHGEKTASFSVDAERQLFYCFGCKAGGDVIRFVMDIEHLSYPEAVEFLAERAHVPLPQMMDDADYERRRSRRERLLEANREAARFYHEMLFRPEGAASLAYLRKRGLSDAVIRKFGLGAAPDAWSMLTEHLQQKGFSLEELSAVGLTVVKPAAEGASGGPRSFDMFRNRAIFPIIDAGKNVIAFGGRNLDKQQPKYLNTADTPVFNKRRGVYAANLLRAQRHLDRVILVEGYMDVVSLTQFGVEGVCATLGTALTNEQARLLRRFAPQVWLAYDGDAAGQKAILRGLDILREEGIPARVLDFPDGLDPDEFIRRDGPEAFNALPSISAAAYRLRRLKEQFDLSSREGKIGYARAAADVLRPLDPVERSSYLTDLTVETGFARETLLEQMNLPAPRATSASGIPAQQRPVRAVRRDGSAPASAETSAQETLLALLATGQLPKDMIEEKDFEEDELKSLYTGLVSGVSPAALVESAPDEESRSRYTKILLSPVAENTDEMIAMANQCLSRLRKAACQKRFDEMTARIAALPPDDPAIPGFLREAQEIHRRLDQWK